MLKIIAGKYKNRLIPTRRCASYRPSTSKLKESIFSILTSGVFSQARLLDSNSKVLDLFAGTGSLGFEALSRGAGHLMLIDINADYLKQAKEFCLMIEETANTQFLQANAAKLPAATSNYDLIFIDPPYHQDLAGPALKSLKAGGWLKNGTIIVVELAKSANLVSQRHFQLVNSRISGEAKLLILKYCE